MATIISGDTGITTPAETVQGALTTTGNTILGDASTDTLNVGNGGLVKDASGNVGIGTASPTVKLDVNGNARLIGTSTSSVNLGFGPQDGASGWAIGNGLIDNTHTFRIYDNTAGVTRMAVDSTGLLQFNSGYGSVATAYGCRAWVNFNGVGTVAIRASGNVSSITDGGTGTYAINFTSAMPDANYVITGLCSDASVNGAMVNTSSLATSAANIQTRAPAGYTPSDQALITIAINR